MYHKDHDHRPISIRHLIGALVILTNLIASSVVCSGRPVEEKVPVTVSVQWLNEHLKSPEVVVLHIATILRDYQNGHIEGARFLWPGWLIISNETESTVPADIKSVKEKLEELGITNDSHIVLCGTSGNINQVCRIYITLDNIGLAGRTSILEGGFNEWVSSGGPVSSVTPAVKKGKIKVTQRGVFVDTDWVAGNLGNSQYFIIDARPKPGYDGIVGSQRQGHVPGARNLPSSTLYDSKTYHFLPADQLKEAFSGLQIPAGARPVFYCGTGNSACPGYVAAVIAGFNPLLYDGSMEAWSSRLDLPVEKSK